MFSFNMERMKWGQELGRGNFGGVYPYQKNPEDKRWAVKNIYTRNVKKVIESFQETALGFSCDHPCVLPVRGFFIDYKQDERLWNIYLKLPRMKSSLRNVIDDAKKDKKTISEDKITQYFYEITQGLQYLHDKGIAHRDIKPENILLDEAGAVKIADFGLGILQIGESSYAFAEQVGSYYYAAPENRDSAIVLKTKNLFKADLWSLGMIIFELCTLKDLNQIDLFSSWEVVQANLRAELKKIGGQYSKVLIGLIRSLLCHNPSDRKSLEDVTKELVNAFGTRLRMVKLNQGIQNELESKEKEIAEMRESIDKLKKEIQIRDANLLEMEKYYEGIKTKFELRIKELEAKLEAKKEIQIRDANLLEMKKYYEGIKTEFELRIKELEAKLEAKKEKLESRNIKEKQRIKLLDREVHIKDAKLHGKEKHHQKIVMELESKVKQLRKKLRPSHLKEEITSESEPDQEEDEGDSEQQKVAKDIQTLTQELKRKWDSYFEIKGSTEFRTHKRIQNKISVEIKQNKYAPSLIDDQPLKDLMDDLVNMYKNSDDGDLQYLNLGLSGCKNITDEGLQEFASQLGQNFRSLKHIMLSFEGCIKISDQGFQALISQIGSNFKSLQTLALSFDGCSEISDQGIQKLSYEIGSNLKNLKFISLIFNGCQQITDASFLALGFSIGSNLKNPENVELFFRRCACTDQGMRSVLKALSHVEIKRVSVKDKKASA